MHSINKYNNFTAFSVQSRLPYLFKVERRDRAILSSFLLHWKTFGTVQLRGWRYQKAFFIHKFISIYIVIWRESLNNLHIFLTIYRLINSQWETLVFCSHKRSYITALESQVLSTIHRSWPIREKFLIAVYFRLVNLPIVFFWEDQSRWTLIW